MAASRRPCCTSGGGRFGVPGSLSVSDNGGSSGGVSGNSNSVVSGGGGGAKMMMGLLGLSGSGSGGFSGSGAGMNSSGSSCGTGRTPDTLLDICARIVAQQIPFQRIEERYDRIPEPVQRRVIFWSFPRNERDICMYSSLSRPSTNSVEYQNLPFHRGLKLLESGSVDSVLQVGTFPFFYFTPTHQMGRRESLLFSFFFCMCLKENQPAIKVATRKRKKT